MHVQDNAIGYTSNELSRPTDPPGSHADLVTTGRGLDPHGAMGDLHHQIPEWAAQTKGLLHGKGAGPPEITIYHPGDGGSLSSAPPEQTEQDRGQGTDRAHQP